MKWNVSRSGKKSDISYIDGEIYLPIIEVPSGTLFEYRNYIYLMTNYLDVSQSPYCFAMGTGEILEDFDPQTKVKLLVGTIEITAFSPD